MNAFGKFLAVTLGGVIGGAIGYFASNLIIYKMEEKVFGEMIEEEVSKLEEGEEEEEEEEVQMFPIIPEGEVRVPKNYSVTKSSLDSLASKYAPNPETERDEPYLLTEEEYQNDNGTYHQESLIYWAKDEQLTDIYNELVENPKKMVGSTTLTKFGFIQSDPDILYVRDEKKHREYEISRVEKSYAVEIRGDDEPEIDPPKPVKRKPKVKKTYENSDDE